jgi:hypothetical protein
MVYRWTTERAERIGKVEPQEGMHMEATKVVVVVVSPEEVERVRQQITERGGYRDRERHEATPEEAVEYIVRRAMHKEKNEPRAVHAKVVSIVQ